MELQLHTRRPFGAYEEDVGGWHVLRVTGEVDAATAGVLPTLVIYAVRRGATQVCLDLSAVERLDPSGAASLRRCTRAARHAGGRVAMIGPDDPGVAGVIEDSGLERDMPVFARREQLGKPMQRRPRRPGEPSATRPRRPAATL